MYKAVQELAVTATDTWLTSPEMSHHSILWIGQKQKKHECGGTVDVTPCLATQTPRGRRAKGLGPRWFDRVPAPARATSDLPLVSPEPSPASLPPKPSCWVSGCLASVLFVCVVNTYGVPCFCFSLAALFSCIAGVSLTNLAVFLPLLSLTRDVMSAAS